MGDRYPGEEALESLKQSQDDFDMDDEDWIDRDDGPGGRLFAVGQEDQDTSLMKKFKDKTVSKVSPCT